MRLSAAERARLIERLIASLDTDPDVEEAWAAEVERRNDEIERRGFPSIRAGSLGQAQGRVPMRYRLHLGQSPREFPAKPLPTPERPARRLAR